MPSRQDKTPKKKSKKKSPQESEESEDPAMDEAAMNRLLQNAFDQAHAQAEQKFDDVKSAPSIPLFIDNQACLSVTNHPNRDNSTKLE